jgi:hypothetical protein
VSNLTQKTNAPNLAGFEALSETAEATSPLNPQLSAARERVKTIAIGAASDKGAIVENIAVADVAELKTVLEALPNRTPATDDGKTESPWWVPADVQDHRDTAHTTAVNFLCLDFDGTEPPWERLAAWPFVAHSTHSHQRVTPKHPTPEPCWRVFVELDSPQDPSTWAAAYKTKCAMHDLPADRKCADPAHFFYAPPLGAEWRTNEGLNPMRMPTREQCVAAEHISAVTDRIQLPPGCFDENVLEMVLKGELAAIGRPTHDGERLLLACATVLTRDFCVCDEDAMAILQMWNETELQIDWSPARIARAIERSPQYWNGTKPGSCVLKPEWKTLIAPAATVQNDVAPAQPKPGTPEYDAVVARNQAAQAAELAGDVESQIRPFDYVDADSMDEPLGPVPWLCLGLGLAPGRPSILVAYAGAGKTLAAQDLALSVAAGKPVFGDARFGVRKGSVVHFDVDQGKRATVRRYQRLALGRGIDLRGLDLKVVAHDGHLSDAISYERMRRACEGRSLCIIDSLRGIAPGMDENSSEFGGVLQNLAALSDDTGCTFLLIHHEGKPSQGGTRGAKHAGRGSSAIQDRAGNVWRLVQDEKTKAVRWEQAKVSEHCEDRLPPFSTRWVEKVLDTHSERLGLDGARIETCKDELASDAVTLEERLVVARALCGDTGRSARGLMGMGLGIPEKRLRVVLAVMHDSREVELRGSGPTSTYRIDTNGQALLQKHAAGGGAQ